MQHEHSQFWINCNWSEWSPLFLFPHGGLFKLQPEWCSKVVTARLWTNVSEFSHEPSLGFGDAVVICSWSSVALGICSYQCDNWCVSNWRLVFVFVRLLLCVFLFFLFCFVFGLVFCFCDSSLQLNMLNDLAKAMKVLDGKKSVRWFVQPASCSWHWQRRACQLLLWKLKTFKRARRNHQRLLCRWLGVARWLTWTFVPRTVRKQLIQRRPAPMNDPHCCLLAQVNIGVSPRP